MGGSPIGSSLENISSNSLKRFSIGGGRFISSLLVTVHVSAPLQKIRLGVQQEANFLNRFQKVFLVEQPCGKEHSSPTPSYP